MSESSSDISPIEHVLKLEQLDADLFRSAEPLYKARGARGIFGGNVISQSLMAAIKTVPETFQVHSMHCYFLLAGDSSLPVLYFVERIREGKSFCTRTVQARQKGRCIFSTTISFQIPVKTPLNHQVSFPGTSLPQPEDLPSLAEYALELYKAGAISKTEYEFSDELSRVAPTESKTFIPQYSKDMPPQDRRNYLWIKAKGNIQEASAHAMALAYMSDNALLGTSVRVNGIGSKHISMMVSLDHIIYFHAPIKADEWLLYEMQSPWTGSARGLVYARVFSRDGTLLASVIQEGVVRLKDLELKSKSKL
ncbi:thioesterase-like superfamily-domain-containing protein [Myxozyma melibiosi]|uniref:Thioesterase-like superfamily-domain-containing protein n=1 Tax=Myxozyma melibiosi TaxID=54550 RepID=A0ABR1F4V7_9ASCO